MKRLLSASTLLVSLVLFGHVAVHADVGEMPEPGGAITPGDKNEEIEMASENVSFEIRSGARDVFGQEFLMNDYYAHVKAEFGMVNKTDQDVSKTLFFPFHSEDDLSYFDAENKTKNVSVKVGDDSPEITFDYLDVESEQLYENKVVSGVFDTVFPAGSTVEIVIEYDLRAVNEPKSEAVSFEYMMQTGSHWAGKIGQGTVTFDFWQYIDSLDIFSSANDFFKLKDGDLVWEFAELEPSSINDIKVTFVPAIIQTWGTRFPYISSLQASEDEQSIYHSYGTRTGEEYPGGYLNASVINVLDTSQENNGWIVEVGDDKIDAAIQFVFDGTYTVSQIKLRPGILDTAWSNDTDKYYDTFKRPKTLNVVYSDGTAQTLNLLNKPGEVLTKDLLPKKTTSLKLVFEDAYAGVGDGDNYFGVGRIELSGVEKVEEVSDTIDEEQADQTDETDVEDESTAEETAQQPISTPVASVQEEEDSFQDFLTNPAALALGGVAGGGVVLSLGMFFRKANLTRLGKKISASQPRSELNAKTGKISEEKK